MSHEGLALLGPPSRPLLIVLSGLSGAGKDAVLDRIKNSGYALEFVVTVTTRAPRPGEKDGSHYHFVSESSFREMMDRQELLESARVYGHWYGVPRKPVERAQQEGRDVIVKVDVQGAATIKKIMPRAIIIFLTPPSIDDLARRLKGRRTETPQDLALRIRTAEDELKQLPLFDYVVVNRQGEIDRAVENIKAIVTAEKCRVPRELLSA